MTVVFRLAPDREKTRTAWLSAWPDALAFVGGLAVARWAGWTAGDLVWSLWLSSLLVGSATIVWMIVQPAAALAVLGWKTRNDPFCTPRTVLTFWALILMGGLSVLAFFIVLFGGFHYAQSGTLVSYFPIDVAGVAQQGWPGKLVYSEIFRRYWSFLPSAFLSHRAAFLRKPLELDRGRSLKPLAGIGDKNRDFFVQPFRNVARMHGLIVFFFLAHFAGLENFVVYAVIYAVYFFPWRLVRRERSLS